MEMKGYIRPDRRRRRPEKEQDIGAQSVDALNKVVLQREQERTQQAEVQPDSTEQAGSTPGERPQEQ